MATTAERSAEMSEDEKRIMREGAEATRALVKTIGVPGQMTVIDDLPADGDERVPMMVKRPFILTLFGHRQVKVPAGIRSVPVKHKGEEIANHPYLGQHGVERYNVSGAAPRAPLPEARPAPQPHAPLVLLACKEAPAFVKVGEAEVPISVYVTKAFDASGLSADEWNRLDDSIREDAIGDQVIAEAKMRKRIADARAPKREPEEPDDRDAEAAAAAERRAAEEAAQRARDEQAADDRRRAADEETRRTAEREAAAAEAARTDPHQGGGDQG